MLHASYPLPSSYDLRMYLEGNFQRIEQQLAYVIQRQASMERRLGGDHSGAIASELEETKRALDEANRLHEVQIAEMRIKHAEELKKEADERTKCMLQLERVEQAHQLEISKAKSTTAAAFESEIARISGELEFCKSSLAKIAQESYTKVTLCQSEATRVSQSAKEQRRKYMETMAKALETRKGLEEEISVLKKTIAEEKNKVSEDKQSSDQKTDEPSADTSTHENTSTSKNAAKARNKVCIFC